MEEAAIYGRFYAAVAIMIGHSLFGIAHRCSVSDMICLSGTGVVVDGGELGRRRCQSRSLHFAPAALRSG
jgi:hypothetical protein